MPKQKITKDMVVKAAFELVREGGTEQLLVKNIAERLGCSVQPVYCYCKNMEGLKKEVLSYTQEYLQNYIKEHLDPGNLFQSIGMTHAQFAKQEPQLYRFYFLRNREEMRSLEELYERETDPNIAKYLEKELSVSEEKAKQLHLNLMIYNIGISFILSTLGEWIQTEEILPLQEGAYQAFYEHICKSDRREK